MIGATALILVLSGLGQVPVGAGVSAQDPPDGVKSVQEGTPGAAGGVHRLDMKELKQAAGRYQIAISSDLPKNLVLGPEPVLHWTNPMRGTVAGAVFVWVADGRPEAVASLYQYTEQGKTVEDDEFQSLAITPLSATRDGQVVWAPRTAGVELVPIPDAPKPAATPAERLRQMRALANEFHAFFDLPKEQSELRLLPKPLFRYETKRPDLPDGALFAFVQSTDPEVLLVIEARSAAGGGAPVWHYGFARMSMVNLRAQHKNRNVWSVSWATYNADLNQPYVTLRAPDRSN
jgi:hypothetical protein